MAVDLAKVGDYLARFHHRYQLRRGLNGTELNNSSAAFENDPAGEFARIADSEEGRSRLAEDRAVIKVILALPGGKDALNAERKALKLPPI